MMSKRILLLVLVVLLSVSTSAFADERVKKMQFIVTSPDAQTQMMAMVLSMQSMKKGADVSIVLCGPAAISLLKAAKRQFLCLLKKSLLRCF